MVIIRRLKSGCYKETAPFAIIIIIIIIIIIDINILNVPCVCVCVCVCSWGARVCMTVSIYMYVCMHICMYDCSLFPFGRLTFPLRCLCGVLSSVTPCNLTNVNVPK
jgi:hypothetical protein